MKALLSGRKVAFWQRTAVRAGVWEQRWGPGCCLQALGDGCAREAPWGAHLLAVWLPCTGTGVHLTTGLSLHFLPGECFLAFPGCYPLNSHVCYLPWGARTLTGCFCQGRWGSCFGREGKDMWGQGAGWQEVARAQPPCHARAASVEQGTTGTTTLTMSHARDFPPWGEMDSQF